MTSPDALSVATYEYANHDGYALQWVQDACYDCGAAAARIERVRSAIRQARLVQWLRTSDRSA